jgi:hypothetical protein
MVVLQFKSKMWRIAIENYTKSCTSVGKMTQTDSYYLFFTTPKKSYAINIFQIGEGAFGEVFLLNTDAAPVLKIVPVDGSAPVNGQPQTKLSDMLAEIVISTELSQLGNRETSKFNCAENFVEVILITDNKLWCEQKKFL